MTVSGTAAAKLSSGVNNLKINLKNEVRFAHIPPWRVFLSLRYYTGALL